MTHRTLVYKFSMIPFSLKMNPLGLCVPPIPSQYCSSLVCLKRSTNLYPLKRGAELDALWWLCPVLPAEPDQSVSTQRCCAKADLQRHSVLWLVLSWQQARGVALGFSLAQGRLCLAARGMQFFLTHMCTPPLQYQQNF